MTDYKNELEQILERFAKFYANTERTLSPPFATAKQKLNYFNNHDYELYEATEAIEALLSRRELEAMVDELIYLANHANPMILNRSYIQQRIKTLTNREEAK